MRCWYSGVSSDSTVGICVCVPQYQFFWYRSGRATGRSYTPFHSTAGKSA